MLEMKGVHSFYGRSPVLQDVSFEIESGSLLGVLGRNGVGKTTLLRTIMGLTDHMTGHLRLKGDDIGSKKTFQRSLRGIGYIPQGREIIGKFTVFENIQMGTFARRDGKRTVPDYVFDLFPELTKMLKRRGGDLSGGQQQQLAIARALAMEPEILLLDEPTEGIQPSIVAEIEGVIERLNQEKEEAEIQNAIERVHNELGLTIILVEQNVAFVRRVSNEFLMMDKGHVVANSEISDLTDALVNEYMTV